MKVQFWLYNRWSEHIRLVPISPYAGYGNDDTHSCAVIDITIAPETKG